VKQSKPISKERGQVWLVLLQGALGREINTKGRPCIIVSNDTFNKGESRLVVIVPITGTDWENSLHVRIEPPEGGLKKISFAACDQVRTLDATLRFGEFLGAATEETMDRIADRLAILLDISTISAG